MSQEERQRRMDLVRDDWRNVSSGLLRTDRTVNSEPRRMSRTLELE